MLAHSRDLLEKKGLADPVEPQAGDAAELPYGDGSLDKVFTNFTLELFGTPEIPTVLNEILRVLRPGGRLAVVALSKEVKPSLVLRAFEWTHKHFPNLMDFRSIYVRRAVETAGFDVRSAEIAHICVPVEIVLAVKP